ncbi:hypothetical protein C8R45DRAFT_1112310 [Mycena sanguinolenta]|nr:hypothetical protein C8R45DRAFT_1112310 [Mycena sanguinolenta]
MQCRILLAFVVSLLTVAVTAAPVPESTDVLKRIEDAPFVGISDVARAPEPEAETETEEARACRLYSCI